MNHESEVPSLCMTSGVCCTGASSVHTYSGRLLDYPGRIGKTDAPIGR